MARCTALYGLLDPEAIALRDVYRRLHGLRRGGTGLLGRYGLNLATGSWPTRWLEELVAIPELRVCII